MWVPSTCCLVLPLGFGSIVFRVSSLEDIWTRTLFLLEWPVCIITCFHTINWRPKRYSTVLSLFFYLYFSLSLSLPSSKPLVQHRYLVPFSCNVPHHLHKSATKGLQRSLLTDWWLSYQNNKFICLHIINEWCKCNYWYFYFFVFEGRVDLGPLFFNYCFTLPEA